MKIRFVLAALFVASLIAGCESRPPQISIDSAKAELSPAVVGEAMVTMNIKNQGGSDSLTGVKTDIPGAKTSLHVMKDGRMTTAESMKVPALGALKLKMGGSHVMVEEMPKSMKAGAKFNLTLVFEKSGEKQLVLTLEPAAAMPMEHEHRM